MSEYWKSTPKYFCKHCKDYFKDTKFERQQHEATPRHQGNIQRSLRGLHKAKEQADREQERAKAEVARLNAAVGSKPSSSSWTPPAAAKKEAPKQASAEDRKRQIKQLADMGVAVPEEFRREMALAGSWQTVSVKEVKRDEDELKPEGLAFGVRKRKLAEEAEDEAAEAAATIKHKQWGSKFRTYPGKKSRVDDGINDIDALLGGIVPKRELKDEMPEVKEEQGDRLVTPRKNPVDAPPVIKKEELIEDIATTCKPDTEAPEVSPISEAQVKTEEPAPGAGIVFKKRKKVIRPI